MKIIKHESAPILWTDLNVLPLVTDQGNSRHCMIYSSISSLECALKIKNGCWTSLSKQFVLDTCPIDFAVDKKNIHAFFSFLQELGIPTAEAYPDNVIDGRLVKQYMSCNNPEVEKPLFRAKWREVRGEKAMEVALSQGPLVGFLRADEHFKTGVDDHIYTKDCAEGGKRNHAVLILGHGIDSEGNKFWLIQNSWGTDWGMLGRAKILKGRNLRLIEKSAYYPEVIDLKDDLKELDEKKKINVVVIGSAMSGKSTATGRLIYKLSGVPEEELERVRLKAEGMKKGSSKFAWVLDNLRQELGLGIERDDIDSLRNFETSKSLFTVVNTPGHPNFVKNMVSGTSKVDCIIFIVDSTTFGTLGMVGQIREQADLASTFGVRQLICCCNKMDATKPRYSQATYKKISEKVTSCLKSAGYHHYEDVIFVPISGEMGDNMFEISQKLDWYTGPTLLEALDHINEPMKLSDMPLRLSLEGVQKVSDLGKLPFGTVETGVLKKGTVVSFALTGSTALLRSIRDKYDHKLVMKGLPGRCVCLELENRDDILRHLNVGDVVSDLNEDPVMGVALSFTAVVYVSDGVAKLDKAYTLKRNKIRMAVKLSDIQTKIDLESGTIMQLKPKILGLGDVGKVKLTPTQVTQPILVETVSRYPPLARFEVVDGNRTVAVGVIVGVEKTVSVKKKGGK